MEIGAHVLPHFAKVRQTGTGRHRLLLPETSLNFGCLEALSLWQDQMWYSTPRWPSPFPRYIML